MIGEETFQLRVKLGGVVDDGIVLAGEHVVFVLANNTLAMLRRHIIHEVEEQFHRGIDCFLFLHDFAKETGEAGDIERGKAARTDEPFFQDEIRG